MKKAFLILLLFTITMSTVFAKEIVLTKDNSVVLNGAFTGKSVSNLIGEIQKLDVRHVLLLPF